MSTRTSSQYDTEDEIDDEQAKIANCIRNVANFSTIKSFHLMDKGDFDPEMLNLYMKESSPKLIKLLSHIEALDKKDQQEYGHVFKHMIFTDVKSSTYGTKILASAFLANGFTPGFKTQGPGFTLLPEDELSETKGKNFAVLMSKTLYDRPMNVRFKKSVLEMYNDRTNNTYGDNIRFIILDQGFKEGIDLFDVKYVHLFEPLLVPADEKQAIGRGTRFCGQMGLEFHPRYGWPLFVYKYNVIIPNDLKNKYKNASDLFELYLQYANIDLRKVNFAAELETIAREAAVDAVLTEPIHKFSIQKPPMRLSGGDPKKHPPPNKLMSYSQMQNYISTYFMKFKYPNAKLENKCMSGGAPTCGASFDFSSCGMSGGAPARQIVSFTPTQDFVRHFFQPTSAYKGMLYYHSVGTGKTCSAIATATTSFEKEGYTILWVTRHTLKSDIWKNMYSQICSLVIREQLENNTLKLPQKIGSPMKYVSENWMQPISYKQFSNLLLKKNKFYEEIVKRNGESDPLKKTLLIIDEAHKLYSPTVAASEKPNTDILEKMIQNSYKKSGDNSVRIILMTGTPYTEDGMEMVKLINLLKEPQDHLETNFDKFGQNYLDNQGFFTANGSKKFKNELSGYISYVNRSQDARNFSYPVMEHIDVPISTHKEEKIENKLIKAKDRIKVLKLKLKDEQLYDKNAAKACGIVQQQNLKKIEKELKKQKQEELETCKQVPLANGARASCKESVNNRYIQKLEEAVQKEQEKYNTCIANIPSKELRASSPEAKELKELQEFVEKSKNFKKGITTNIKEIRSDMKEKKKQLKELEETVKEEKRRIRSIKDKDTKKKQTKEMRETIGKKYKELKKEILNERNEIVDYTLDKKKYMLAEGSKKLEDISQVKALEKKCGVK